MTCSLSSLLRGRVLWRRRPRRRSLHRPESTMDSFRTSRRQILVKAFGGRTLHVDLSYRNPLVRKSKLQTARHCDLIANPALDTELPMGWQWFGCVCHRPVEWPEGSPGRHSIYRAPEWGFEKAKARPGEDNCLRGGSNFTECVLLTKEDQHSPCFIGVMGWLLTCRQA